MSPISHSATAGHARAGRRALPRMSHFALEHLLSLPAGVVIALVWANTFPESYFRTSYAAAFVVNDIAMVLFFAIIGKEVVESTAPGGVLHPARRAAVPFVGAVGAVLVTLLFYEAATTLLGEPMLSLGWPATLGTDLALSYVIARLIFGRHPAVAFLLLVGMSADAFGFVAVALVQPSQGSHPVAGGVLMLLAVLVALMLRAQRVKSVWPYVVLAGGTSWAALFLAGAHPAFALIPILPFLPHAARDPGFFVDAPENARDTLSRLELAFRYPAHIALFCFGLVNGGVVLQGLELGTWSLPLAVLLGKPAGLMAGVGIAVALGLHLPAGTGWRELAVVGILMSIGFTVSLFFASAVLPPGQLLAETKMGALLTVAFAGLAVVAARILRTGRYGPHHGDA